jgi:hypothetical protein
VPHITFIHGIGNKPEPDRLLNEWKIALSDNDGVDLEALGVTTSMVYWADLLYAEPVPDDAAQESSPQEVEQLADPDDADLSWLADVPAEQRAFVEGIAQQVGLTHVSASEEDDATETIVPNTQLEAVPLPPWLKKRLMRVFLRDVHHYIYDVEFSPRQGEKGVHVRSEIRARALTALNQGDQTVGPHLVVGHSLGTVVAYDSLQAIDEAPPVDALITVGSPLGMSEIRQGLTPPWTPDNGWPVKRLGAGTWSNIFDELDPVCGLRDRKIAIHYRSGGQERVSDVAVSNDGYWRHSIGKYLGQVPLRRAISEIFE